MTCCCTGGPAGHQTGYDFRRLFTLSEFHDRDRDSFYAALQQVRVELDLTGWLAYFVHGLATQLAEIRARSEIARDGRRAPCPGAADPLLCHRAGPQSQPAASSNPAAAARFNPEGTTWQL